MRRILYSLTFITTILPFTIKAQEATPLSLDEAVDYALVHQAKMKNAYLDQKSSLARNREVTGLALPNLKGTASVNYAPLVAAFEVPNFIKDAIGGFVQPTALNQPAFDNSPNTLPLAFQPKWTTQPQLEASQLLFEPSVFVALQARKKLEVLAQKSVELTAEQVKVAVIKAYYNILIAEKRQDLLDQNIVRISQLESETKEIYKNGFAEKVDVDRVTVILTNLKTEKNRIDQLVDLTYLALKFQIGMPLTQVISLNDSLSDASLNSELLAHEFDINNRKEYQMMKVQNQLLGYDLKRYKMGVLPTLSMYGNYGYTLYNSDKLFASGDKAQKAALIGAKLTLPLFDGFQRRNKMLQATYALQKNDNDIVNLKYGLELEKENARITLQSNIISLENQRKNMKLAEEVYNISKIKYKEGVGSSLEVTTAESSLKEAQTNYFTALYDAITARTDLQKALGEL